MDALAELPELCLLDEVPLAVVATDLDGRIRYANAAAEQLCGHGRDALLDLSVIDVLVQPDHQQPAVDILANVLAGRTWNGEFDVRRADGTSVRVQLTDVPLVRDGRVVGVLGVAHALTGAGRPAPAARLDELGRIAARLAAAPDLDTVAAVVTSHAAYAVGAYRAALSLRAGESTLRTLAVTGASEAARARFATYAVDDATPVGTAVLTREPVLVTGRDELERRYPGLVPGEHEESLVALPLLVQDRCVGGIALAFPGRRVLPAPDLTFLATLADTAAQAIDRLEAQAAAEVRARRLAFLADASAELAGSLDYETTLTNVARTALGELADWVGVELVDGGRLRPVVTMHVDPAKVALAERMRERYPTPMDADSGVPAVVRSGVSELYEYVPDEVVEATAVCAEHLELVRQLALRSVMIVPLPARGRILGALVLVSSDPRRLYTREDLTFAEDLGRRAAVAIDNAQLHSQIRDASLQLQHAVLPAAVTSTDRWSFDVCYRPAGRTEVGGDFFDAVELPDGRAVAFVGDVMGRGVDAAAAMAQVRAALRAYVAVDPSPAFVLERLTCMFDTFGIGGFVTVAVALADPAAGAVTFASAGHPPPVLLDPEHGPATVDVPPSPPLGTGAHPRAEVTVPLPPGTAFCLYTDGLVERRGEDIDAGIARLVGELAAVPGMSAQALVARLAPSRDDDVTALLTRRGGGRGWLQDGVGEPEPSR